MLDHKRNLSVFSEFGGMKLQMNNKKKMEWFTLIKNLKKNIPLKQMMTQRNKRQIKNKYLEINKREVHIANLWDAEKSFLSGSSEQCMSTLKCKKDFKWTC